MDGNSSNIPTMQGLDSLYPVVIVQDRYFGLYSGATWFAVAMANTPYGPIDPDPTRIAFCLDDGPNGTDEEAVKFWQNPPKWIATGSTPEQAFTRLCETFQGLEPKSLPPTRL